MPKRRKRVDRRPNPNLTLERRERRARRTFKQAQTAIRNVRAGGVSLQDDPFEIIEELVSAQNLLRRYK